MSSDGALKVMVSSPVFGFESFLDQVYGTLKGYGYEVWMSHKGTIPVNPKKTAFENCLAAVERCDVFLGVITGRYGSGLVPGEKSITHLERCRAHSFNASLPPENPSRSHS